MMLYVQHTYSFFGFRMEDKSIPPLKDVGFVCPPYLLAAKAIDTIYDLLLEQIVLKYANVKSVVG
ncbi:MAG: hypothetical protein WB988_25730 [Candidatus Nitrosopolaris sp.]